MDYLIYFIVTIAILVFVHEFGHFAAAKLSKMRVDVLGLAKDSLDLIILPASLSEIYLPISMDRGILIIDCASSHLADMLK